jgi:hypothetical protein
MPENLPLIGLKEHANRDTHQHAGSIISFSYENPMAGASEMDLSL